MEVTETIVTVSLNHAYRVRRMKRIATILVVLIISSVVFSQENQKNLPEGYGDITWGTPLKEAKDKIRGKIVYTDDKRVIISRDGSITYYYGFLYLDPSKLPSTVRETEAENPPADNENAEGESRLFYVALSFPYLDYNDVKKKLEDKFGEANMESIKDMQGSMAWTSDKTVIILWVDRYEDNPYSRRITYISQEISKELNEYQDQVFNRDEIEVLNNLSP
jgi:hypothetical protein